MIPFPAKSISLDSPFKKMREGKEKRDCWEGRKGEVRKEALRRGGKLRRRGRRREQGR